MLVSPPKSALMNRYKKSVRTCSDHQSVGSGKTLRK